MITRPKIVILTTEFGTKVRANIHIGSATIKMKGTMYDDEIEQVISFLRKIKKEMNNCKQGDFE